jgi:DNA primase
VKNKFVPASVLEQLRKEVDVLALIGESVQLSPRGREWRGQCPFHDARRKLTFCVFPERKAFRCMSCGAEGDAIDFVMKLKRCTFREAVAILSLRFLPAVDPVLAALEEATSFYERILWDNPAAEPARQHLRDRGIRKDTAQAWRLGYAPAGWTNLTDALHQAGIEATTLEAAGLAVARTSGKGHYDRFRARLMIPIRRAGQVVGFGGRLLEGSDEPKYLNSPETSHFQKSETLFGLDQASAALSAGTPAVVVEGYFDAIALHQAGIAGAVAICGSAANEKHLSKLVEAGAREICFAFDGDPAGKAAAARAAILGLGATRPVKLLECPDGLDPDELIQREGADGFRSRMASGIACANFLIEHDLGSLPATSAVEQRVAALSRVASELERAGVRVATNQVQRLAQLVGCGMPVMEEFLRDRSLLG